MGSKGIHPPGLSDWVGSPPPFALCHPCLTCGQSLNVCAGSGAKVGCAQVGGGREERFVLGLEAAPAGIQYGQGCRLPHRLSLWTGVCFHFSAPKSKEQGRDGRVYSLCLQPAPFIERGTEKIKHQPPTPVSQTAAMLTSLTLSPLASPGTAWVSLCAFCFFWRGRMLGSHLETLSSPQPGTSSLQLTRSEGQEKPNKGWGRLPGKDQG